MAVVVALLIMRRLLRFLPLVLVAIVVAGILVVGWPFYSSQVLPLPKPPTPQ